MESSQRLTATSNSGLVAACPKLTELTVTPDPYDTKATKTGVLHDPAGTALSAISELVVACEALPDFDTFQTLHVPVFRLSPCWCGLHRCDDRTLHEKQWEESRREQARGMKDYAIDRLKTLKSGRHKAEGMKRTIVRIVGLSFALPHPDYLPGSVEVEEYEV